MVAFGSMLLTEHNVYPEMGDEMRARRAYAEMDDYEREQWRIRCLAGALGGVIKQSRFDAQNVDRRLIVESHAYIVPSGSGPATLTIPPLAAQLTLLRGFLFVFPAQNLSQFTVQIGDWIIDLQGTGASGQVFGIDETDVYYYVRQSSTITATVNGFSSTNTLHLFGAVWGEQEPVVGVAT